MPFWWALISAWVKYKCHGSVRWFISVEQKEARIDSDTQLALTLKYKGYNHWEWFILTWLLLGSLAFVPSDGDKGIHSHQFNNFEALLFAKNFLFPESPFPKIPYSPSTSRRILNLKLNILAECKFAFSWGSGVWCFLGCFSDWDKFCAACALKMIGTINLISSWTW